LALVCIVLNHLAFQFLHQYYLKLIIAVFISVVFCIINHATGTVNINFIISCFRIGNLARILNIGTK